MAFSFGAPAPAPTGGNTAAAPAGGLFGAPAPSKTAPAPSGLFGAPAPSASTPAPAGGGGLFGAPAPSTNNAPAGGLFGSTPAPSTATPAAAPTAAAAGGLFGAAPAPSAPAPAPSGGLFGAPAPSTAAPATPAPGGLFGAAPAASTTAPAPSGGLFGSTTAVAPSTANLTAAANNQPIANIPAFHTIFPRLKTRNTVLEHIARVSGSGRELIHILSNEECGKLLSNPKGILTKPQEDTTFRNALVKLCDENAASSASNPTLGGGLSASISGGAFGTQQQQPQTQNQQVCVTLNERAASLTPSIAKDILRLSNELHISVIDATALFAEANALVANNEQRELEDDFCEVLIRNGKMGMENENKNYKESAKKLMMQNDEDSPVISMARHLFFHERAALLSTILDLIRCRIQAAEDPSSSSPIIVASDQLLQSGLVTHLIASIRELNDVLRELRRGLKNAIAEKERTKSMGSAAPVGSFFGGFGATPATAPTPEQSIDMEFALLGFTQMQRQLAAECLFYLAYHTQLSAEEVASMIDLIKDLTNGNASVNDEGLPLLDPLKDIPNPYEEDSMAAFNWQQQQQYGAWNKPLSLKAKDSKAWNDELISSLWAKGQPQLLQCVSTLIMCVTCALDARHILMNRQNHGPNPFGKGNALLPPIGDAAPSSLGELQAVHSRLDPESQDIERQWKRRDIWGLLLIPYALLLRNAAGPQLLSPTKGRSSPTRSPPIRTGQVNLKAICTKSLMVASQLKSLTFARMSLIPSFGTSSLAKLEMHGMDSSIVEFYVSVFADFTSQFIDALCATGNLPITRKEWYDEEFNLAQTEWAEKEQRRQFGEWSGRPVLENSSGPKEVNIMDRPDCLEDIFALVSSICSSHPEGSKAFWKIIEHQELDEHGMPLEMTIRLAPSRFLERLDLIRADSDSLLFVYLSFLASLALADGTDDTEATNGASTINSFLCGERTINPRSERHTPFGWQNIINAIRWYAEQLSPDDSDNKKSSSDGLRRTSSKVDASETSTSYYYGINSGNGSSAAASSPQQGHPLTPDDPKSKQLDEVGTNTLMALLCLVSNVAARSSAAREHILGIGLPISNSDTSNEGYQEGSLEILFSLLTTPISTDIQGMTFTAIANLLQPITPDSSTVDTTKAKYAKRAWELLEMIQLIPVKLLENGSLNPGIATVSSFGGLGRNQITNSSELPLSIFPSTADYGLIYQLEHVESETGVYPSTEGFLYLLTTLIRTTHQNSRVSIPYVEFVTNFVLPRATGSMKNVKPLPFATVADECRLINRALECVEAILVRYVVPFTLDNFTIDQFISQYKSFLSMAKKDIGVSLIPEILRDADSIDEEEMKAAIQDFKNIYVNPHDIASTATAQAQSSDSSSENQTPKTPGFFVMANILSFNKSGLFSVINTLLSQHQASSGVHTCGEEMLTRSIAAGLFRETPPSIDSSKRGIDLMSQQQRNHLNADSYHASISMLQQSMIESIHPVLLLSCTENSCQGVIAHGKAGADAILWRERNILLSLRILSAAAVRETSFIQLTQNTTLSVVPTLSFKGPIHGSFAHRLLEEDKVFVSKLANIVSHQPDILPLITDCVGYNAAALKDCQEIAKNSFCLVSYVTQTFSQSESSRFLRDNDTGGLRLAHAFSKGLSLPTSEGINSLSIQNAILDLVLSNFDGVKENLALTILGLGGTNHQFLDVILGLISDVNYVVDTVTSSTASKCYEVVFRMMQVREHTPPVLMSPQFWLDQIRRYLGMQSPTAPSILHEISSSFASDQGHDLNVSARNNNVLHSIAWLLKGLSLELFALVGEEKRRCKSGQSIPAQSLVALLGMLFSQSESLLQVSLLDLPIGQSNNEFLKYSLNSLAPTQDALKDASAPLPGPTDVCARFELLDMLKLQAYFGTDQESAKKSTIGWATAWNAYVHRACACSHITHAWSDLCRTAVIVSNVTESSRAKRPFANTRVITEILCTVLLRLNTPDNLDQLVHFGMPQLHYTALSGGTIETESATPLSVVALCLTDFLHRDLLDHSESSDYVVADEDIVRICALLDGSIASASDERVKILKCALAQMHALCEGV